MTEAIGSEKQVVSLVCPVSALGADKDDLVLYALIKSDTQLCNRVDLKDAALVRRSGTDRLLSTPCETVLDVAAEDMERNLILGSHVPTGAVGIEIELVGVGGNLVDGLRLAGDLFVALGAVDDLVVGAFGGKGSRNYIFLYRLAGSMLMRFGKRGRVKAPSGRDRISR